MGLPKRIYLYRTGTFAIEIAATLAILEVEVLGFIDHKLAPVETWQGYRYAFFYNNEDLMIENGSIVIIAIHNLFGISSRSANLSGKLMGR